MVDFYLCVLSNHKQISTDAINRGNDLFEHKFASQTAGIYRPRNDHCCILYMCLYVMSVSFYMFAIDLVPEINLIMILSTTITIY